MVEWNRQVKAEQEAEASSFHPEQKKDEIIFPIDAATTLRNYIDNFMVCTECRENFVAAFDSSWHNLNDRIVKSNETMDGWIELPMWLFEIHNAVNIQVMKAKAIEANHIVVDEDVAASTWPSRKDCPHCYNEAKGSWKKDWHKMETFNFLRLEYWYVLSHRSWEVVFYVHRFISQPHSFSSFRPEDDISTEIRNELATHSSSEYPLLALGFLPFASITILCVGWYIKKLQRRKIRQLKNF